MLASRRQPASCNACGSTYIPSATQAYSAIGLGAGCFVGMLVSVYFFEFPVLPMALLGLVWAWSVSACFAYLRPQATSDVSMRHMVFYEKAEIGFLVALLLVVAVVAA